MQAPCQCYSFLKYFFSMVGIFWQEKCIFDRKFCNYQDKFRKYFLSQRNMNQAVLAKWYSRWSNEFELPESLWKRLQFFNFSVIWRCVSKNILMNLYSWKKCFLHHHWGLVLPKTPIVLLGKEADLMQRCAWWEQAVIPFGLAAATYELPNFSIQLLLQWIWPGSL